MATGGGSRQLFQLDGKPPVKDLVPLSLQHVVAAVVGIVSPAIIVANAFGLEQAQGTLMIQVALVLAGLLTMLQAHPLFGRLGSGLPVVMGTSFAFVPAIQSFAETSTLGAVMAAQVVGGLVAVAFGLLFRRIRRLFPPVVTGTVVLCIGMSLYTVAVGYMAGGPASPDYGSARNWIVALVTMVACAALANFGKGVLKLGSLLFGLLVGYAVAAAFGMVGYAGIESEPWFTLPAFMPFAFEVDPAVCATMVIIFVVCSVQVVGDLNSASVGGLDRPATDREVTGAVVSQGLMSVAGALFGALPAATFGQNVGIVVQTKVVCRRVFLATGAVLLAAGLLPRLSFVLAGIPQAVIGGATISVFGAIAMTGIRILVKDGFSQRDMNVAGLSVALGMGISLSGGCLTGPGMPPWIDQVFGSSAIVAATLCAVVLNLVLPREEEAEVPAPIAEDTQDPEVVAQEEEIERVREEAEGPDGDEGR